MTDDWYDELTPREKVVLAEARSGGTTAEIAARLFVAPSTVKTHLSAIYLKAGAASRVDVLAARDDPELLDLKALDLSPRQEAVVRCVLRGMSNREIAARLFVSLETVKDHLARIYQTLGVHSRYEVVGLVTSGPHRASSPST